jgi:restriction system protein
MGSWAQYQREREREQARIERERQRALREQERQRREAERERARQERAAQKAYADMRVAEAQQLNAILSSYVEGLGGLLAATLRVDDYLDFESLKEHARIDPFDAGDLAQPEPEPSFTSPEAPSGLRKLLPGAAAKHDDAAVEAARAAHEAAVAAWREREDDRVARFAAAQSAYDEDVAATVARVEAQNAEVDAFRVGVEAGEPDAVGEVADGHRIDTGTLRVIAEREDVCPEPKLGIGQQREVATALAVDSIGDERQVQVG